VIALTAAPFLLDHPKVSELFAPDAIKRARELVKAFNGGVGAYQVCGVTHEGAPGGGEFTRHWWPAHAWHCLPAYVGGGACRVLLKGGRPIV